MDYEDVCKLVARKAGLNLQQNRDVVETSVDGALEELSLHITLPDAILSETKTIAADASYVAWTVGYSRLVSVKYRYNSGSDNYDRPLTKASPTALTIINAGKQGDTTDYLTHYCPKSQRIYVGPGAAYTGGSIIVEYQRKLKREDVEKLPDANALVWGGLANVLPLDNPSQPGYRTMFINQFEDIEVAAQPTAEQHDQIRLPNQMLADMRYIDSLGD